MPDNRYVLEVDPSSALAAFKEMQKAQKLMETDAVAGAKNMSSAMEDFSKRMVTFRNRENQAQERNIKNLERQADLYGRSGIEKLSAQRDNLIRNLQREGDQYGKLEERINRVRAAYQKMIDTENQRKPDSSNQSGLLALRGLRDLFEGRTAYGEVQLGKSLMGMSGNAAIAAGSVAAIAGLTAASLVSAKALSEWAVQTEQVKLRMGVTTQQVQLFDFAAKLAGQDVTVFERSMRGLTKAVEDSSSAGQQGREWLGKLGVDVRGLRDGSLSTTDAMMQLSRGLNALPNTYDRNEALLKLFNRMGIEGAPAILKLSDAAKTFAENPAWSRTDAEFDKAKGYHEDLVRIEEDFKNLKMSVEFWLAGLLRVPSAIGAILNSLPGGAGKGRTDPSSLSGFVTNLFTDPTAALYGGAGLLSGMGKPTPATDSFNLSGAGDRLSQWLDRQKLQAYLARGGKTSLEDQIAADEKTLGGMENPHLPGYVDTGNYAGAQAYDKLRAKLDQERASLSASKSLPELVQRRRKELDEARSVAAYAEDITPLGRAQRELADVGASNRGMFAADRAKQGSALDLLDKQIADQKSTSAQKHLYAVQLEVQDRAVKTTEERQDALNRVLKEIAPKSPVLTKEQSEEWRAASQIRQINDERDRYGLTSAAAHTMQMSQIGAAGGGYGEQQSAITNATQQRLTLAKQIGDLERKQADDALRETGNESQHRVDMVRAQYNEEKEIIQTRLEGEEKIAELRKKEIDDVKKQIEGLMDTLLTHPSHFGSALAKYAKGQLIHGISGPISGGLAQMIVGGGGGGGGMGGSGGGGIGSGIFGRIFGGGGGSAGGSYSIPTNYSATQSDADRVAFGVGVGLGNGFGIYGDGGIPDLVGTRGEIDPRYSPGRDDAGPGPTGAGGYGGSSSHSTMPSAGGLTGLFKGGLGSMGLFNHRIGSRTAVYDNTGQPVGGPANANYAKMQAAGNQALFTGGTALATSSLTGNYRGTALGTLGGAVGGAAAGFGIAGPIGAAVGGAVGLGIGLGEQIAGVQSDRTKAINAVKQTYHISISNTMADQIASLAQSKYGDNVNTAVHSPEVRQMLGVYAAGTGQRDKFPLSANTPYGAGAVESGGRLFQNPTYQYGSPETYKSNLPVYGGNPGGTIPYQTGSGPTYLSMNVNGSGMSQFMTGEVVTPSFVQGQTTAAWAGSNGRTDNSMVLQEPGSLVG